MDQIITNARIKMDKALSVLHDDLATIRAGRANGSMLDGVSVKVYGGTQELTIPELATITVQDAKTLAVTPFDISIIEEIERGLRQANLGVTVRQDGEIIRITTPPLTSERRKEYIKLTRTKAEGVRVMIRQIRQDAVNSVRRQFSEKAVAEDEKFRLEKEIQNATDEYTKKVDEAVEAKVTELGAV